MKIPVWQAALEGLAAILLMLGLAWQLHQNRRGT